MSAIGMALNGVVDHFVPDHMRGDIGLEKRVRMFIISHLVGPFLGLPIPVLLLTFDPAPYPHVLVLTASIIAFWLFPLALRFLPRAYVWLANLSITNLGFAVLWGSFHYGGMQSPFLAWYLVLPLLAFFYVGSGARTNLIIFMQIVGGLAAFAIAGFFSNGFPEHLPMESMSEVALVSTFSAALYIFFMAAYYASVVDSQSEFLREMERHRDTLAQLTLAKEEAEQANRAKSDFLAKMSHELRTPLNAVLGYSEILLEDAELDGNGSQVADLEKISGAGKHLLSMVNDILDISKIEAGKTDLYIEEHDFGKIIDEIESTARPLAAKNANKLVIERGKNLGTISVDGTKLRQIIYNLLSNASKFTKSGAITLSVERCTDETGIDRIRVGVSDDGIGISEEGIANLFSNFAQADASINSKFGGTGLGLSLSRNFAILMGGDITVTSVKGEGATFLVDLPAVVVTAPTSENEHDLTDIGLINNSVSTFEVDDEADDEILQEVLADRADNFLASKASPLPAARRGGTRDKIILVDDDRDFLDLTERLLSKEGYSTICTDSPRTVLQLARTVQPVAVIVDIRMPGFNGWDVLAELKSSPITASIPVIMTSILEDRKTALSKDADGFVEKPFTIEKLQAALDELPGRKVTRAA
ncbi:ATP-binding protein [Rhizobiaceae bacterium]|nr:ATP-binding protein [Rhizobiaceae bacterium]